jgi:tetratricopeptide (TPR) repeat protein
LIVTAAQGVRPRLLLAAALALAALAGIATARADEPAAGPGAEEAADFARRAAYADLHGPPKIFLESIDADGVLQRLVGPGVWAGLTERQQNLLRAAVRDHFVQALAPPSGTTADVAWASVADSGRGPIFVYLGLRYGASVLKTRWTVQRTGTGWAVEDIVLVDPGLSLASEVGRLLGPEPVRRRDAAREARARATPRLAGVAAIIGVVLVFARRLPPERRRLLWIAAVPALLFLVDGALAVQRSLSEPYALVDNLPPQPWRQFEKLALAAQAEGKTEAARDEWSKALASGAPAGPVHYQMGLSARGRGAPLEAASDFDRALAESPAAPGAARELAAMALADGRNADARALLQRYLREAGPDPETLSTLAVVETNLGDAEAAVETIRAARALVGEDWRKTELEARIYARAGNAAAAVAALRPLEADGKLDRSALRSEPAYLPIATDSAWVSFLGETPK